MQLNRNLQRLSALAVMLGLSFGVSAKTQDLTRLHIVGANYDEHFVIVDLEREWADGATHVLESKSGSTAHARLENAHLFVDANGFTYKLPVAILPTRPEQNLPEDVKLQLHRQYEMTFARSPTQTDRVHVLREPAEVKAAASL
jgi:hypothetical protein